MPFTRAHAHERRGSSGRAADPKRRLRCDHSICGENQGGKIPAELQNVVNSVATKGATPLVVAEEPRWRGSSSWKTS